MAASAVLAIDQGTSATKAVVVLDDGSVAGLAEVAVDVVASPDGGVELDPEALGDRRRLSHRRRPGP